MPPGDTIDRQMLVQLTAIALRLLAGVADGMSIAVIAATVPLRLIALALDEDLAAFDLDHQQAVIRDGPTRKSISPTVRLPWPIQLML